MSLGCNIVFIAVLFLATRLNACHTLSSKTPNDVAHISNASRGPWHRERRWGFRCRAMYRPSFSSLLRLPVASRYGAAGATAIGEFGESLSARRGGGYCCRPVPCPPSSSFLPPAGAAAAGAEWCGTCCRKRSFNSCSLYSFLSSSCSIALRVRLNSCKRQRPSASRPEFLTLPPEFLTLVQKLELGTSLATVEFPSGWSHRAYWAPKHQRGPGRWPRRPSVPGVGHRLESRHASPSRLGLGGAQGGAVRCAGRSPLLAGPGRARGWGVTDMSAPNECAVGRRARRARAGRRARGAQTEGPAQSTDPRRQTRTPSPQTLRLSDRGPKPSPIHRPANSPSDTGGGRGGEGKGQRARGGESVGVRKGGEGRG